MRSAEEFETLLEEINTISNIDFLGSILIRINHSYGLKHSTYYVNPRPGLDKAQLLSTYNQVWIDIYTKMDYFLIDPIISTLKNSIMPIEWSKLASTNKLAMNFFGEANEFGIGKNGLTLPIRGVDGSLALLSITSDLNELDWQKSRTIFMRDFQILAHALHAKAKDLSVPHSANSNIRLSPRELQCLQWAARGKTNDDVAAILGISERVVRAYFESARFKLNAINKNQAVAKALGLGLIQSEIV